MIEFNLIGYHDAKKRTDLWDDVCLERREGGETLTYMPPHGEGGRERGGGEGISFIQAR